MHWFWNCRALKIGKYKHNPNWKFLIKCSHKLGSSRPNNRINNINIAMSKANHKIGIAEKVAQRKYKSK